jgi:rod shape-determining protein MreC
VNNLLRLLLRNGGLVTFVFVQAICFYLIVQYNERQGSIWAHSSGLFSGGLLERRQKVSDYFSLSNRVDSLLSENAALQAKLANASSIQIPYRDTFFTVRYDSIMGIDSLRKKILRPQFGFIAAKVINNSISGANNWLMLNQGSDEHVQTNLGVVTAKGIVGIVRHVDSKFSMVMSILHRQAKISACLPKHESAFGSLTWEGGDPSIMTLRYIPKHFDVKMGDLVETSGLSLMFPKGIRIGWVSSPPMQDKENPYFLIMNVRLSQSMASVQDVFIVNNLLKAEIDTMQTRLKQDE